MIFLTDRHSLVMKRGFFCLAALDRVFAMPFAAHFRRQTGADGQIVVKFRLHVFSLYHVVNNLSLENTIFLRFYKIHLPNGSTQKLRFSAKISIPLTGMDIFGQAETPSCLSNIVFTARRRPQYYRAGTDCRRYNHITSWSILWQSVFH